MSSSATQDGRDVGCRKDSRALGSVEPGIVGIPDVRALQMDVMFGCREWTAGAYGISRDTLVGVPMRGLQMAVTFGCRKDSRGASDRSASPSWRPDARASSAAVANCREETMPVSRDSTGRLRRHDPAATFGGRWIHSGRRDAHSFRLRAALGTISFSERLRSSFWVRWVASPRRS